ncbi:uncharacterized protein LOC131064732 [Cryptomeria japonica]|uniref:uncharacterized protein LOC131064732 n=1 Tax=Cryptomeria japonica TaxID=3369 RepID=UPI0025AC2A46|nr:uncharacterized protein LOC131064732 [Cryptomeria japonica]XP_057854980.1 uncharacterized protein LOC131064732 [Cryptomeria japonica]XP_057854981.1 uncharacterized protein LOC131064732 [Cryptomeria japonica]XP_057854982.1 uncharacterized protein LOC131064732 [Cryptomeria japonica]
MGSNSEHCTEAMNQASGSGDGGSFDCNICLELAQDPVVTLCGHLFCWPCLYRWLQEPSISKECPVCKATVVEDKVIPLYGRGKVGSADPRTKSVPGLSIPDRPSGQRPDTVRTGTDHHYQSHGFNFMAGPGHMPVGSFGNVTFSAGFGLFPSLFGFQMHGFADAPYGSAGMPNGFHHGGPQYPIRRHRRQEAFLSRLFVFLLCCLVACLLFL